LNILFAKTFIMGRPGIAVLSRDNLRHNARILRKQAGSAKLLAVVKADAYGHGSVQVAKELAPKNGLAHVDGFAVACLGEALNLKVLQTGLPILLIQGLHDPDQLKRAILEGFEVVLHSPEQLAWLEGADCPKDGRFWVKIDTGMGRLGICPSDMDTFCQRLARLTNTLPVLMGHFACADIQGHPLNQKQIDLFQSCTQRPNRGKSLCNSAGMLAFPDCHFDWVRPGLALYGVNPLHTSHCLDLRPVMTVKSRLVAVKVLKEGSCVGYGQTYTCPQTMPVGIVGFGYGDGYPAAMKMGAPVWIGGQRCPLIGRVSMDMMTVDLRPAPWARLGDEVELWGNNMALEEVAPWSPSHTWHMLTGLQARLPRRWCAQGQQASHCVQSIASRPLLDPRPDLFSQPF
jgi:alanine racemase